MGLKELLANKRLEPYRPNAQGIAKLFVAAEKYLEGAANATNAPTIRFVLGYTAALEYAKAALRAAGYRTRGLGQHETAFEALPDIIGPPAKALSSYFNRCRRTRNTVTYDEWVEIPQDQVDELVNRAKELGLMVRSWIQANHPKLLPASP